MKTIITFSLIVLGVLFLEACLDDDDDTPCLENIGPVVAESRQVSNFHGISLAGVGNVLLTQGSPQSLRIETHERVLDLLRTTVANEVLQIDLNGCIEGDIDQLDIFITIPDIEFLAINGVGSIDGQNDFELDELDLELTGVGDITVSGTANLLEINSTGVGNINAFEMTADQCIAVVTGTGNVEVTVISELDVTITGVGNLSYKGNPDITSNITGLGQLIDAN